MNQDPQIALPDRVEENRRRWQKLHRYWWFSHYSIGVVAVVASSIAAADTSRAAIWGVIAATAASIVTFLGPMQKAQQYHRAFHMTDQACLDLEIGKIDVAELSKVVNTARMISLGDDPPQP